MKKFLNILLVGALILSNTSCVKIKQVNLSLGASSTNSSYAANQAKLANQATLVYNNGLQALKDAYTATKKSAKLAYDSINQDNIDTYVNTQAAAEAGYNAGVAAYKETYARGKVDSQANAKIASDATSKALSSLASATTTK